MVKSEPPVLNRRRSNRQNPSPKSGGQHSGGSDVSSKEETTGREIESKEFAAVGGGAGSGKSAKSRSRDDILTPAADPPLLSLRDGKDTTSKDEKVKKWIEDSNNVLTKSMEEEECVDKDNPNPSPSIPIDTIEKPVHKKVGRKAKFKRGVAGAPTPVDKKKIKKEESDSEPEVKSEEAVDDEVEEEEKVLNDEAMVDDAPLHQQNKTPIENNNLATEKDRTSAETTAAADTLSAFCNIVENAQKLQSHPSVESTASTIDSTKSDASPTKDHHHHHTRRKHHGNKRKRSQSTSVDLAGAAGLGSDDSALKSPREKREKQMSPPLEYNPDFVSDLGMPIFSILLIDESSKVK